MRTHACVRVFSNTDVGRTWSAVVFFILLTFGKVFHHFFFVQPSAASFGTTISATKLFSRVPVRRQLYKAPRRCREELRAIEEQLLAFALAAPGVRFQLTHNKQTVWQKTASADFNSAAVNVFGSAVHAQLQFLQTSSESTGVSFSAVLPKRGADPGVVLRSTASRSLVIVNKRPVEVRAIHKVSFLLSFFLSFLFFFSILLLHPSFHVEIIQSISRFWSS